MFISKHELAIIANIIFKQSPWIISFSWLLDIYDMVLYESIYYMVLYESIYYMVMYESIYYMVMYEIYSQIFP